jgi:alpha-1,2-mannosyltransferase
MAGRRTADLGRAVDAALHGPWFRSRAGLVLGAVFLSAVFLIQVYPYLWAWNVDTFSFYTAAEGVRRHVDIYDEEAFGRLAEELFGKTIVVYPYLYWPLLAEFFAAFTSLPAGDFFVGLNILNIVLVVLMMFLLVRLLDLRASPTFFPTVFLFFLLVGNAPLRLTLVFGQVNLIFFDLTLLALLLLKRGRPYLSSLVLCLAILVKVYPVLFLAVFLLQRRWRYLLYAAVNGAAVFLLSVAVFGTRVWLAYLSASLKTFSGASRTLFTLHYAAHANNNSVKSFLLQLFPSGPAALLAIGPWLTPVLLAGFVLLCLRLGPRLSRDDFNYGASLVLTAALLISPLVWFHHYLVMIFPLAYLMSRIVAEKRYVYLLPYGVFAPGILYPWIWGGFPFNQLRLLGTAGFFIVLLRFGRKEVVVR